MKNIFVLSMFSILSLLVYSCSDSKPPVESVSAEKVSYEKIWQVSSLSNPSKETKYKSSYGYAVAAGNEGRIYVADQTDFTIHVFDSDGKKVKSWGFDPKNECRKSEDNGWREIVDIALDSSGKVFVLCGEPWIRIYSSNGKFIEQLQNSSDAEKKSKALYDTLLRPFVEVPQKIVISRTSDLFIMYNNYIEKWLYNGGGGYLGGWTLGAKSEEAINIVGFGPHIFEDIAVSNDGHLWGVNSFNDYNVYEYDENGQMIKKTYSSTSKPLLSVFKNSLRIAFPAAITADQSGNIYLYGSQKILVIDKYMRQRSAIDVTGVYLGSIAVDEKNNIYAVSGEAGLMKYSITN